LSEQTPIGDADRAEIAAALAYGSPQTRSGRKHAICPKAFVCIEIHGKILYT
jgi:hypothetical protein